MIIDTHCHLDDISFDADLSAVLERAKANNIDKIIIPGANINDLAKAQKIANKYENIYFSAGVHPYHADEIDENTLEKYLKDKKCVAVGECGLDYFRLPKENTQDYKATQKAVFLTQIQLAIKTKKPLIVHVRDANEDCFNMIKANFNELVGGVFHCYNASPIFLDLSSKFYFGIGGVLTFKNAKNLVEILPKIPKERLLLETDAPYLAPVPKRGERNEPAFTSFVAAKMSEILNLSLEEVENLSTQNALRLFAL